LNSGPPAPKAGALPGCATPRHEQVSILAYMLSRVPQNSEHPRTGSCSSGVTGLLALGGKVATNLCELFTFPSIGRNSYLRDCNFVTTLQHPDGAQNIAWWIPIAERSDQAEESGAETVSGYRSLAARVRIQCGRDCRASIEGRDLTVREIMSALKHEILAKL
jgi:hypothetical protein